MNQGQPQTKKTAPMAGEVPCLAFLMHTLSRFLTQRAPSLHRRETVPCVAPRDFHWRCQLSQ